jgi:hypothetical protein
LSIFRCFYLTTVVFITSCAQIVAPSGGDKDDIPPKVLKEYPATKTTSFNEKRITIKFDEFIQLKDMEEQLVISPPMDPKPIIEVQGKNIVIELRGTLAPNTTYTINFGNSIVDNHENTVLSNYSYVLATGSLIDTLRIKGRIYNAFTTKPEKGILICLYPTDSFSDSTIIKQKPLYFTKTTETGFYSIHNLPQQQFMLVAFKDDNKNLKYDKNESMAFYNGLITTSDTIPIEPLLLFKPNLYPVNKIIDTIARSTGLFKFVIFNPYKVKLKPLYTDSFYTWSKPGKDNLDTLLIYSHTFKSDSVWFQYQTAEYDTQFYVKPSKMPGRLDSNQLSKNQLNSMIP